MRSRYPEFIAWLKEHGFPFEKYRYASHGILMKALYRWNPPYRRSLRTIRRYRDLYFQSLDSERVFDKKS